LEDVITNFERVCDHCSNIAVCMLRVSEEDDNGKEERAPWFEEEYRRLREKYALPRKKADTPV
jgi:phosphate:Na+ symporter